MSSFGLPPPCPLIGWRNLWTAPKVIFVSNPNAVEVEVVLSWGFDNVWQKAQWNTDWHNPSQRDGIADKKGVVKISQNQNFSQSKNQFSKIRTIPRAIGKKGLNFNFPNQASILLTHFVTYFGLQRKFFNPIFALKPYAHAEWFEDNEAYKPKNANFGGLILFQMSSKIVCDLNTYIYVCSNGNMIFVLSIFLQSHFLANPNRT